jgi:hypothetical protein
MKRVLAVALLAGLILPTTAAAHFTVMKPGSRFWVLTSPPSSNGSKAGKKPGSYAVCRHGYGGRPEGGRVFTTLDRTPLVLRRLGTRPGPGFRRHYGYRLGKKWHANLRVVKHRHPRIRSARAFNPKTSRTVLFFWHCKHPRHGAR